MLNFFSPGSGLHFLMAAENHTCAVCTSAPMGSRKLRCQGGKGCKSLDFHLSACGPQCEVPGGAMSIVRALLGAGPGVLVRIC